MALSRHEDGDVRALTASVMGAVGGEEGVERLRALLEDPAPEARAAAARALGHLRHWPAAGALAGLLGDRAWDVRRAAATSLRELGAPGTVLLRRAMGDEDRFARDMARQTLDVPTGIGPEALT